MFEFDDIVLFLRKNKYRVRLHNHSSYVTGKKYRFAEIKGRNIHGGFCTQCDDTYPGISRAISADHVRCYDKWSKCPLKGLPFPDNTSQLIQFFRMLEFLGSKEGWKQSNSFEYDETTYRYCDNFPSQTCQCIPCRMQVKWKKQ